MDIFKIARFLYKHRKIVLLVNHVFMILELVSLLSSVLNGKFAMYPAYYIWMFILQLTLFIILSIQFSEEN